jgi:hypothetical protein
MEADTDRQKKDRYFNLQFLQLITLTHLALFPQVHKLTNRPMDSHADRHADGQRGVLWKERHNAGLLNKMIYIL